MWKGDPGLLVGEGPARRVVRKYDADLLVGGDLVPGAHPQTFGRRRVAVVGHVGPLEGLVGSAAATEVESLVGNEVGEEGHAVDLALVRHRVDGVRVGRREDHVDPVVEDQVAGHLGGTVGPRLAIDDLELELVQLPVAADDAVRDASPRPC